MMNVRLALLRSGAVGMLLMSSAWMTFAHAQSPTPDFNALPVADVVALIELEDRWAELTSDDPARPTPFSQTGIETLAKGLAALYALPLDQRSKQLEALRQGNLAELLPAGELAKYCAESDRIATVVTADATGPLTVRLPAQIVHAAPVLAALQSVLTALLSELDGLPGVDEATARARLIDALGGYIELQQARAALELVVGDAIAETDAKAASLLKAALQQVAPATELLGRLPAQLPELPLCRAADHAWPALQPIADETRVQWRAIKAAFAAFVADSRDKLQAIVDQANAAVAGFTPLKEFVEPALTIARTPEQLAKWRVGFDYAAELAGDRGHVELVAINQALGLTVPLGVTIDRVTRTRGTDGTVSLHFIEDALLQTGTVDTPTLQMALGQMGLPGWARIISVDLSVGAELQTISLVAHFHIDALDVEIDHKITLHDGSTVIDFDVDLKQLVDDLATALTAKLLAAAPSLSTAWGTVALVVDKVTAARVVVNQPWTLTIEGKVPAPFGAPGSIAVTLELGSSRDRPFQLVAAKASPKLEAALLEGVNSAFEKILLVANAAAPPEAHSYLASCLALTGVALHPGTATAVALSLSVEAGGVPHTFEVASPDLRQITGTLIAGVKEEVGLCIVKQLALYVARTALGLTPEQVQAYLDSLRQLQVNLLGIDLAVANLQPPAGKRGFIFDLVGEAAGGQVRLGRLELRVDLWQPGKPLVAAAVDFSAATIGPDDVRRLLLKVTGLPERLLDSVGVALRSGVLVVTPRLMIEALGGEVVVPPIELRPEMTAEDVRDSVLTAANAVVGQLLQARLGTLLADIGPIKSLTVDGAKSVFLPVDGQDAAIALKVLTQLGDYFDVSWDVTLTIDGQGRSSVKISAGSAKEQVAGALLAFMGDALKGIAPGGVENIVVLTSAPYGVGFDVAADIGGFKATINGVKATTKGIELSSRLKLEYRQPPGIPIGAFQALPVEISIDLKQLANFEIGAFITFASDSWGVIGLDARLRGEGGGKRLATEAVIKILHGLSLVKSTGVVDFSKQTIVMRTQTVGAIAKLLDIGDQITITANPMQAEMAARVNVLGLEADGHLRIAVDGKQARVTLGGTADLLLGQAEVNAVLDSRMRGIGVSGTVSTFVGPASLTVSPGAAQAELNVHGFRIKLIAPSVKQLTRGLLEEALQRLFDFKFSWESIKNREIVISLLDPDGRTNTDPVGGDPSEGKADDVESARDKPGDPPPAATETGGGGDASGQGAAPGGCGLANSSMVASDSKFPGHVVEITGPENNTYFYWHTSRVAPKATWDTLKAPLPQIACFTFDDLPLPYFSPKGYDVRSPLVQVFVQPDNQPVVMVWRKDQTLQVLPYSGEEWSIALNGADPAQAFQLASDGLVAKGFARRVLRLLVARAVAQLSETMVDAVKVQPTAMEGTGLGSESGVIAMVQANDRPLLRIFAGTADEVGNSPDIGESDPLFPLLQTAEQRKGPLGQLLVAATATGKRLRVLYTQDQCTLVVADAVKKDAWAGRLFAVTPSAILSARLIIEGRTEDAMAAASGGDLVCAALLGSDGAPRWEAVSGALLDDAAVFAFGRGVESPDWSARLTVRPLVNPGPDTSREGLRADIEAKLAAWSSQGLVSDGQLATTPLDAAAVLHLLDTLVLPEAEYLKRLLVNPRGLL